MTHHDEVAVYLEVGLKRVVAGALDWPGWCRVGKSEGEALQLLLDYGPRYERVMREAGIEFHPPSDLASLKVAERLDGGATTDFGVPNLAPSHDKAPVNDADLERLRAFMQACWQAFDAAVDAAEGKELRKGPKGGGRDVAGVVDHTLGAEGSYLVKLGGERPKLPYPDADPVEVMDLQRAAILDTLGKSARGEVAPTGPRGGARWSPRYFVRRAAWHVLDHLWEIEDKVID